VRWHFRHLIFSATVPTTHLKEQRALNPFSHGRCSLTTFKTPARQISRDSWGRPLIPGPDGTLIPYMRTTRFVSNLSDQTGLHRSELRKLAVGLANRPDQVLAITALDADEALASMASWGRGPNPAREALDDTISVVMEPASAPAAIGTALHGITQRVDLGQKLGRIPDRYAADIAAYIKATKGLSWIGIEEFRIHDSWRVAGTADRRGVRRGRLQRIADIKTGSIDYSHAYAMQIAMYAHSVVYDIATGTRAEPEADLDLRTGLLVHLPAGQGRCDIYEIDIEKGWAACQLAKQVWDWRATKGLVKAFSASAG
jgi:hypothetical protein